MTRALRLSLLFSLLLSALPLLAQVAGLGDVNTSKKTGDDSECAIAKNPSNKLQLFIACNTATTGLFAARSTDGGLTWTFPDPADKTIADGDAGQGPAACCDPTLAWDTFGNLFITYLDPTAANVVTILSTDGGATFSNLASFAGSVDQPTVVAANTSAPGAPVAVWVVWNQSGSMVARGAAVTGLGVVGAFNPLQNIPGTASCSFGDIAIAPSGAVVQVCGNPVPGQGPSNLLVNTDADGLGPGNFGAAVTATTTNVGGFDVIPPQSNRTVDPEAGLAYDANPMSAHFGRLYLVYTDETVNENNDTDVMLRFSDNNGATWSNPPIRVNGDPAAPVRSQFLPKIATNRLSGNVTVCWFDPRNSATNTAMQVFCNMATPTGASPTFLGDAQISAGASASSGTAMDFGDYSGLAYFQGLAHPAWPDRSNSTGDNPAGTATFDAYTERVTGGVAAAEGDPHMTTVDGVHYDFQGAGEYITLRDADGTNIQLRMTPVPTAGVLGPNGYTGISTCVSLTTAVAARVGSRRLTFQPNISGVPDPSGMQLRIDGVLTTLGPSGMNLGSGGRVVNSASGGGIEVEFPNGTQMVVTPGWWASQGKWFLNVNVSRTPAVEGIAGAIAPGSWLPLMPDGTSLGPRPAALHDRYAQLYDKFGDAWRVSNATTLFDYAPGTSTATFTIAGWPSETAPCTVPASPPVVALDPSVARELCSRITNKNRFGDCVLDVTLTGEKAFARTYILTERILAGATMLTLSSDKDPVRPRETVTFTAIVERKASTGRGAPTGLVQFMVDGKRVGEPVKLNTAGRATWKTATLRPGKHEVSARYIPTKNSAFFATSTVEAITVTAVER